MKTWKQLASGLLALALMASLSCAALAAEPKAEKTVKPTGQFSQWFPRLERDPAAPETLEAVLAKMGTAVRQSKTKNGVTATLNAAVWDGGTLRMSLTVKAPNIPQEVTAETNLYTEECSIALPEKDWKEYVQKDVERGFAETGGGSQELVEKSVQNMLDMGQADYWNHVNVLNFSLVSREKDTLTFEVWMSFKDYLKQPKLTLRLDNIATYEDGKGDRVIWHDGKRTGPGPKDVILTGPTEFTFQLKNILPAARYAGDVKVTAEDIPFRFTGFAIGPFEVNVDYEVLSPVDSIHVTRPGEAAPAPAPDKLDQQDVSKALHKLIQGLWTKGGRYVDLSQRGGGSSISTSPDGTCGGNVGAAYAYPIDPATVTAVDIGGTRVELSGLE